MGEDKQAEPGLLALFWEFFWAAPGACLVGFLGTILGLTGAVLAVRFVASNSILDVVAGAGLCVLSALFIRESGRLRVEP